MDRGIRCTLGCISPRIDEDRVVNLKTPHLAETWLQGCYRHIQGRGRPNYSCLSDANDVAEVEQRDIPSVC